jgi:SAM-dependent methyltransferase
VNNACEHWSDVYRTKDADHVSWFQAHPTVSLRLLTGVVPRPVSVIDVGAGASLLIDALLDAGFSDVTVLDVSELALTLVHQRLAVRPRLADRQERVSFIVADLLNWTPLHQWDAWHDRAVFHFLTDERDRAKYVDLATRAVAPGGTVVIGAFALDGPERCSGLETARYDAEGLAEQFSGAFVLERSEQEVHRTPGGVEQSFAWVALRRR